MLCLARGPGWRWPGMGVLLLMAAGGPSPWYVWFPSWLSGLSVMVAIAAAATGYITWRRSGFTTRNRATIDRRRRAIRVELANTGRMEAAIDSIRLWEAEPTADSVMTMAPNTTQRGGRVLEGIYILELGRPLSEWIPVALPPGRTLHATLTAGLPGVGGRRPGPPPLPSLPVNLRLHRVRVVFGNGTVKDLRISESVLDAYDRSTVGILSDRTIRPRRRPHTRTNFFL